MWCFVLNFDTWLRDLWLRLNQFNARIDIFKWLVWFQRKRNRKQHIHEIAFFLRFILTTPFQMYMIHQMCEYRSCYTLFNWIHFGPDYWFLFYFISKFTQLNNFLDLHNGRTVKKCTLLKQSHYHIWFVACQSLHYISIRNSRIIHNN